MYPTVMCVRQGMEWMFDYLFLRFSAVLYSIRCIHGTMGDCIFGPAIVYIHTQKDTPDRRTANLLFRPLHENSSVFYIYYRDARAPHFALVRSG